jgi:hypothetical protein
MTEEEKIELEKPTRRKIEQQEVEFKKISIKTDANGEYVKQIKMITADDHQITYKPKNRREETEKYRGFDIIKPIIEDIKLDELPEKIYEWNKVINDNGSIKVKANYREWDTVDMDDNPITISYMFDKDFEESKQVV